jgi:hypothetical protein
MKLKNRIWSNLYLKHVDAGDTTIFVPTDLLCRGRDAAKLHRMSLEKIVAVFIDKFCSGDEAAVSLIHRGEKSFQEIEAQRILDQMTVSEQRKEKQVEKNENGINIDEIYEKILSDDKSLHKENNSASCYRIDTRL